LAAYRTNKPGFDLAAAGDVNGDGFPDLLMGAAHYDAGQAEEGVVFVYHGGPNQPAQPAFAQQFGTGCAGTAGQVPVLSAVGLPTSGNPAFGIRISNAISFAPWLVAIATMNTVTTLNASCTLYLEGPISFFLGFTNAAGQDTFNLAIPSTASCHGLELFFQGAVFDSGGLYPPGVALSNALSTRIGS